MFKRGKWIWKTVILTGIVCAAAIVFGIFAHNSKTFAKTALTNAGQVFGSSADADENSGLPKNIVAGKVPEAAHPAPAGYTVIFISEEDDRHIVCPSFFCAETPDADHILFTQQFDTGSEIALYNSQ